MVSSSSELGPKESGSNNSSLLEFLKIREGQSKADSLSYQSGDEVRSILKFLKDVIELHPDGIGELAKQVGVHRTSLYDIANGTTKDAKLSTVVGLLKVAHKRLEIADEIQRKE